jgi:hypothetical protein
MVLKCFIPLESPGMKTFSGEKTLVYQLRYEWLNLRSTGNDDLVKVKML